MKGKGIISLLTQMMAIALSNPQANMDEVSNLQRQKDGLLLNYAGPMPNRLPNQRQRRKLARQTRRFV